MRAYQQPVSKQWLQGEPPATRCGGPEQIKLDGETGMLVDVDNPQMMAEAILCLLKNHQLRLELGAKGRLRVQVEFSCSQFINNIESLYLRLYPQHAFRARMYSSLFAVHLLHQIGELGNDLMQQNLRIKQLDAKYNRTLFSRISCSLHSAFKDHLSLF